MQYLKFFRLVNSKPKVFTAQHSPHNGCLPLSDASSLYVDTVKVTELFKLEQGNTVLLASTMKAFPV